MASKQLTSGKVLDEYQRAAIEIPGNVVVNACPGSGKTTLVVAKIVHELSRIEGTAHTVLCLTFTRAAVRSIKDKLRNSMGDSDLPGCAVSTIHGFALRQVFRPYGHLVGFEKRLRLVGPTSVEYENVAKAVFPHRPNVIERLRYVRRASDGTAISGDLDPVDVAKFWALLEATGLIDFSSLLYYSARLIVENSWISQALSARYHLVIVDEYQDTSDVALDILDALHQSGNSRFLLVGDPRQRIYSFAGVTTERLRKFADSLAPERLGLTGSYRCGSAICLDGSNLMPKAPAFHSNRCPADDQSTTELLVGGNTRDAIVEYYLPRLAVLGIPRSQSAILSSGASPLVSLGEQLRREGIEVTGAPTRPYEESVLTPFAEALAAFARRPVSRNWRVLEDAFFQLFGDSEDDTLVEQFPAELRASLNFASASALQYGVSEISAVLDRVIDDLTELSRKIHLPALGFLADKWEKLRYDLDGIENAGLLLAEQADSQASITLSTIHGAKGLEYRAVALIQFNDGVLPHARSTSIPQIAEDLRKLFVALTRALDYVLYVSDKEHWRNKVSPFASRLAAKEVAMPV